MKQAERDEIKILTKEIITVQEQLKSLNREITENVKPNIADIRTYNKEQNGHIAELIAGCAANKERSRTNFKLICIAIGLAVGAAGAGLGTLHNLGLMP